MQLGSGAETLSDSLMKGLAASLTEKKQQLTIVGSKVEWKILRLIMDSRDKEDHALLQYMGCCGLHVVSGALKTGVVASS